MRPSHTHTHTHTHNTHTDTDTHTTHKHVRRGPATFPCQCVDQRCYYRVVKLMMCLLFRSIWGQEQLSQHVEYSRRWNTPSDVAVTKEVTLLSSRFMAIYKKCTSGTSFQLTWDENTDCLQTKAKGFKICSSRQPVLQDPCSEPWL